MIASTDLEKADVHNTYFLGIFTKEDNTNINIVDPIDNVPQMMDIVVTEDDALNKLLALKKSKSPGPDGIHPHMPKEVAHAVKVPLSTIPFIALLFLLLGRRAVLYQLLRKVIDQTHAITDQ